MKASTSQFLFGILVGALLTCVGFAILGQTSTANAGGGSSRAIKVAHGLSVEHPVHKGIEEFGEELKRLSGGRSVGRHFSQRAIGQGNRLPRKGTARRNRYR